MDTLSHAYLVTGPKGERRDAACLRLAMANVCSSDGPRPCGHCTHCLKAERGIHPDIVKIGLLPDKKELLVDQIRAMLATCAVMPNEAEGKVYWVEDADKMNIHAQNAFLRQLEEPPRGVMFLLAAENAAALLPTVRSRCVEYTAETERRREPEERVAPLAEALLKAAVKGDRLAVVERLFGAGAPQKERFGDFLDALYLLSVEKLAAPPSERAARVYRETAEQLERMVPMRSVNVSQGSLASLLVLTLNNI